MSCGQAGADQAGMQAGEAGCSRVSAPPPLTTTHHRHYRSPFIALLPPHTHLEQRLRLDRGVNGSCLKLLQVGIDYAQALLHCRAAKERKVRHTIWHRQRVAAGKEQARKPGGASTLPPLMV